MDLIGDRDHGRKPTFTQHGGRPVIYADTFSNLRLLSQAVSDCWASALATIYLIGKASDEVLELLNPLIERRHTGTIHTVK